MKNNGKTSHGNGVEELILLQCQYYLKQSTGSVESPSKFQWHIHRTRTNNPKICKEPQKSPNSQNNLKKEQQKQEVITIPNF